jgi:hypothetical protein
MAILNDGAPDSVLFAVLRFAANATQPGFLGHLSPNPRPASAA